jgi:hypothetical protein
LARASSSQRSFGSGAFSARVEHHDGAELFSLTLLVTLTRQPAYQLTSFDAAVGP